MSSTDSSSVDSVVSAPKVTIRFYGTNQKSAEDDTKITFEMVDYYIHITHREDSRAAPQYYVYTIPEALN